MLRLVKIREKRKLELNGVLTSKVYIEIGPIYLVFVKGVGYKERYVLLYYPCIRK